MQARSLGRRTPGGRGTSQVTRAHVLIFERRRFSHRAAPAAAAPSVLPSPKATSSLSSQARAAFAPSVGPALSWVPNPPNSVTQPAFLSPLTSRRLPTTALSLRLLAQPGAGGVCLPSPLTRAFFTPHPVCVRCPRSARTAGFKVMNSCSVVKTRCAPRPDLGWPLGLMRNGR